MRSAKCKDADSGCIDINSSYEPVKWSEYFNISDDIELDVGTFRIYRRGVEGPLLFFIHGGGFSALTWAVLSKLVTEQVKCQCLAVDMRGHGDTNCEDNSDLSIDTLSNLGGAVAVHVACKRTIPSLAGLVVIDVVEGSAMSCLRGMSSFLQSRPKHFRSLSHAIEWSVRSSQIRNVQSARVSFPGQLKRILTGETATSEIEREIAVIHDNGETHGITNKSDNHSSSIHSITENIESEETVGNKNNDHGSDEKQIDQCDSQLSNCNSCMDQTINIPVGTLSHNANKGLKTNIHRCNQGAYTWRIDLIETQSFWNKWFSGLSQLFLSIPEPKLLLLADMDRLDKDLTIGQMQGKFQVHTFPRTGHAVQEDAPIKVAECLAKFLVRNRFTEAKPNFEA